MQFAAQYQIGVAVDDQLRGRTAFFQVWHGGGRLRGENRSFKAHKEQENWQRGKWILHVGRESSIGDWPLKLATKITPGNSGQLYAISR